MIDKQKSTRALQFVKSLRHTKGQWAGQPFTVLPWQEKIIHDIYGTVYPDGTRMYRTAYVEIPKKNGKTELAAALALKHLCADGEYGGEVYTCAVDREQASIVFNAAKQMVLFNADLKKRCKIIDSTKRIIYNPTNSFLHALSSDVPTKHGLNPSAIIFDELHAQPNSQLWDVMTFGSMDARKQPLLLTITTAGTDEHSVCKEQHDYAKKILTKKIENKNFYPVIYGADKKDDWKDPKVWAKANPSLNHTITVDRMMDACIRAQEVVYEENLFRQLRLNQWVNQKSRWLSMDVWEKNASTFSEDDFLGQRCYLGLDLSDVNDLTAYALLFYKDHTYYTITRFFIPEEIIDKKELSDKVPYRQWINDGYVIKTPGNTIDYSYIEHQIDQDAQKFMIQRVGFDRWNADYLVQNLQNKRMVTLPIGMGYYSLNAPTKMLETLLLQGNFRHNNPVLTNHMDNVVIERDAAGSIKPNKAKSTQKIDGIVANIIALAVFDNKTEESIYEKRGALIL